MRRRYGFILTRSRSCACTYCGQWQRTSGWWWLAILACKIHERKCEGWYDQDHG